MRVSLAHTHMQVHRHSQGNHVPIFAILSKVYCTLGSAERKELTLPTYTAQNTPDTLITPLVLPQHSLTHSGNSDPLMYPQHSTHLPVLVNGVKEVSTSPLEEEDEVPETTKSL